MVITLTISNVKSSLNTSTGWSGNLVLASIHSNYLARYQGGGGFSPLIPHIYFIIKVNLFVLENHIYLLYTFIISNVFWSRNFISCVRYWFTKGFSKAQSLGTGKSHLVVFTLLYLRAATIISLTTDITIWYLNH